GCGGGEKHGSHDRGQPRDLSRQGQGRADHHGGDPEAQGGGGIRLGGGDQELRVVGQRRLQSQAHAMVDRQQRRQRRRRGGQEADGRAGRQRGAGQGGGGRRRRPRPHRQVHGVNGDNGTRHKLHLSPRAGRGRIPSVAKESEGIRVRGRGRESKP